MHDFYEGQAVRHFIYGDGEIREIYENHNGETCFDVFFPGLGKTVTVLSKKALTPSSSLGEKEEKNEDEVVRDLAKLLFNISDEELNKLMPTKDTTTNRETKKTMAMNERKITMDNNGNVAGGAVIGQDSPFSPFRSKKSEPENVAMHRKIALGLNELYAKKNADYGDSFHDTYMEEGMAMARIRLSDKLNRFKSLTKSGNQQVNDESVRDTLLDLANYAIMTVIEMDRESEEEAELRESYR